MDEIYALERTLEKMILNRFAISTTVEIQISDRDHYRTLSADIVFENPVSARFADKVNRYVASFIDRNPSLN